MSSGSAANIDIALDLKEGEKAWNVDTFTKAYGDDYWDLDEDQREFYAGLLAEERSERVVTNHKVGKEALIDFNTSCQLIANTVSFPSEPVLAKLIPLPSTRWTLVPHGQDTSSRSSPARATTKASLPPATSSRSLSRSSHPSRSNSPTRNSCMSWRHMLFGESMVSDVSIVVLFSTDHINIGLAKSSSDTQRAMKEAVVDILGKGLGQCIGRKVTAGIPYKAYHNLVVVKLKAHLFGWPLPTTNPDRFKNPSELKVHELRIVLDCLTSKPPTLFWVPLTTADIAGFQAARLAYTERGETPPQYISTVITSRTCHMPDDDEPSSPSRRIQRSPSISTTPPSSPRAMAATIPSTPSGPSPAVATAVPLTSNLENLAAPDDMDVDHGLGSPPRSSTPIPSASVEPTSMSTPTSPALTTAKPPPKAKAPKPVKEKAVRKTTPKIAAGSKKSTKASKGKKVPEVPSEDEEELAAVEEVPEPEVTGRKRKLTSRNIYGKENDKAALAAIAADSTPSPVRKTKKARIN